MAYTYTGDREPEVNAVVHGLSSAFDQSFGENLIGLYLHGSMAMGSFRPWSSDIDLLAVVGAEPTRHQKLALAERVMDIAGDDCCHKIEFSVLTAAQAAQARHPIGYVQHYSCSWHERYRLGQAELVLKGGTDEDLAAHITVLHARGQVLRGALIADVFGKVSHSDYLKAVLSDIKDSRQAVHQPSTHVYLQPAFTVLNLCRTLRYLQQNIIGSKQEGGDWALEQSNLAPHHPVVAAALAQYAGSAYQTCTVTALTAFAEDMLEYISALFPPGVEL